MQQARQNLDNSCYSVIFSTTSWLQKSFLYTEIGVVEYKHVLNWSTLHQKVLITAIWKDTTIMVVRRNEGMTVEDFLSLDREKLDQNS